MEFLAKIKEAVLTAESGWNTRIADNYWPAYHGWLTQKLASYDPFAVLTAATSFAVFFFLILYWIRSRY